MSNTAGEQTPPRFKNKSSSKSSGSMSAWTQAKWRRQRRPRNPGWTAASCVGPSGSPAWGRKVSFPHVPQPSGVGGSSSDGEGARKAGRGLLSTHAGACCCDAYISQWTPETQRNRTLRWGAAWDRARRGVCWRDWITWPAGKAGLLPGRSR